MSRDADDIIDLFQTYCPFSGSWSGSKPEQLWAESALTR
jgi:hypothetical protein